MDLISWNQWNVKHPSFSPTYLSTSNNNTPLYSFCKYPFQFHYFRKNKSCSVTILTHARKKKNNFEPLSVVKPSMIEDVLEDNSDGNYEEGIEEDELLVDDEFNDEEFLDDGDYFEDEYVTEDAEVYAGDGAEGGGVSLAGTWWDKEALTIAENVTESFDGDLGMYAFRTLVNATIQVRIEKLSTKSGSPSMSDIEAFSTAYRTRLDEAELAKTIPENISLEVSSPGVERVIRVPQDLDRFKERPMYVKYITEVTDANTSTETDGIFRLVSFDLETNSCTWGLADVRINREKAGKGRPMSKKQREWRLTTPFDSIRLVRIYSEP
ncbi:hypothetical protein RND81_02G085100 [Saponaria officinalis]|uniref:Ribosome maturation factor RimP N-terminal domain-containing protein n=2 Tax=Saponaria officinalis TaxID=3572 RepID=A0AAW1MKC9_SAPOF